jgi:hypothetical protein
VYFAVVLGIGFAARRRVSDSLDLFLSGWARLVMVVTRGR